MSYKGHSLAIVFENVACNSKHANHWNYLMNFKTHFFLLKDVLWNHDVDSWHSWSDIHDKSLLQNVDAVH